jgi:diguanylate cyclase (GGDEF)-like protein
MLVATKLRTPPQGTPENTSVAQGDARHGRDNKQARGVNGKTVESIEESKVLIHGLIMGVSQTVESLLHENAGYGDTLIKHKAGINAAMGLTALKELERVLLSQVEDMEQSNSAYRNQLSQAQTKIQSQKQEIESLSLDASLDFLTQIPNRRTLDQRLFEGLAYYKRHQHIFSLILLDIDHFKGINDKYGHVVGDKVLQFIADLLQKEKRGTDFLARFGGEEFFLFLPETSLEQAKLVAKKLWEKVAHTPCKVEYNSISVTISAGVTEVAEQDESVADLVTRVDRAMYFAKESGRNQIATIQHDTDAEILV